jgi:hypothetical protein
MRQNKFLLFGIVLLFSACAKEQVDINVGSTAPLFKVNMSIDNLEQLLIEAGKEDFYLYTNYLNDSLEGLLHMNSEFSKLDECISDCSLAFAIAINNIPIGEVDAYFADDADFSKFDIASAPESPGHVVLSFTNNDGVEFRTDLGVQNETAAFTIQSIQRYQKNELGQQTKLLRAVFSGTFYNDVNEQFSVNNGDLVFAVAVP